MKRILIFVLQLASLLMNYLLFVISCLFISLHISFYLLQFVFFIVSSSHFTLFSFLLEYPSPCDVAFNYVVGCGRLQAV